MQIQHFRGYYHPHPLDYTTFHYPLRTFDNFTTYWRIILMQIPQPLTISSKNLVKWGNIYENLREQTN